VCASRASIWLSQEMAGMFSAASRFVQYDFPAPDMPTSARRNGLLESGVIEN
jgi:hypothetical protein